MVPEVAVAVAVAAKAAPKPDECSKYYLWSSPFSSDTAYNTTGTGGGGGGGGEGVTWKMAELVAKVGGGVFAFSRITTAQTELFKIVSICQVLEAKAVKEAQVVLVV